MTKTKQRAMAAAAVTLLLAAAICLAVVFGSGTVAARADTATHLPDFAEDFEGYETGKYIEDTAHFADKWSNNVLRGGEAQGMDSHLREKAKVVYANGADGNKVLALDNAQGANTFFYIGPQGDYRVRNFTASMKVRFLTEGVTERSWVGFSIRKQANVHYTGTNNLMFFIQRYKNTNVITGHGVSVLGAGSASELDMVADSGLYGDKLQFSSARYTAEGERGDADFKNFVEVKLVVEDRNFKLYADETQVVDCTFDVPAFDYFGYMSVNACTANIQIDDVRVQVQDTELPPVIEPLPAVQLRDNTDEKKIEWDVMPGNDGYRVQYGNKTELVFLPEFSYARLKAGTYDFTVTVISGDTFANTDSAPSEPLRIVIDKKGNGGGESSDGGCKGSVVASLGGGSLLLLGAAIAVAIVRYRKREN